MSSVSIESPTLRSDLILRDTWPWNYTPTSLALDLVDAGSTWHRGTSQRSRLVVVLECLRVPVDAWASIDGTLVCGVYERVRPHDGDGHVAIDLRGTVECTSPMCSIERQAGPSTPQPWHGGADSASVVGVHRSTLVRLMAFLIELPCWRRESQALSI